MKKTALLGITLLCLSLWQQVIASPDISSYIRAQIDRMRTADCVELGDCPISSTIVLPALYEKYGYQLIWENADAVTISYRTIPLTQKLNGKNYFLVVQFGQATTNGVASVGSLKVLENKKSSAPVYGYFTTNPPG